MVEEWIIKKEYSETMREQEISNVTFVMNDVQSKTHKVILLVGSTFFEN